MTFFSTYRFQFHKDFTFRHLGQLLSYLEKLGIGAVYASPVFTAVPGSNHGYDGLDPHTINPEIGTEEELLEISARLKQLQMGWLQDIVPNHMAFDPRNPWICDILEKGPQSLYSDFFDLPWSGNFFQGRLMVPFLGAPLPEMAAKGTLKIVYKEQRLVFDCSGSAFPLQPLTYNEVIGDGAHLPQALAQWKEQLPKMEDKNMIIIQPVDGLPPKQAKRRGWLWKPM